MIFIVDMTQDAKYGAVMKLAQYLAENGLKHQWFAEKLGITKFRMSGIITGKKTPTLGEIAEIERLTTGAVTFHDFVSTQQ
ncbi:MAG: helix-turn-helix transcriptional regulator [Rhodospirillales bacterium]|nr:helix-turn-helix transcriptional regulator [Rhodospirillales bacterium]